MHGEGEDDTSVGGLVDDLRGMVSACEFGDCPQFPLRTIEVGGFKMAITLSGSGNAMGCTVSAPYMREQGAGAGRTDSVFGGKASIASMNQTSSQCSVRRG